jgi:hypothetical protein
MLGPAVAVIAAAILFVLYRVFDRRYHGRPSANARPTSEVFRDPGTGRVTRVYEDPETGHRDYRPEGR